MNKAELVDVIAKRTGGTKADTERHLDEMLGVIADTLAEGQELRLTGFGTFAVSQRKARRGRNPQTGLAIQIPATTVPVFRAGVQLREAVKAK